MKRVLAFGLSVVMTAIAFAAPAPQSSSGSSPKKRKAATTGSSVAAQLDQMKQAIDAQQQQIQQLRQDLTTRDQSIQQLQQRLDQGQTAATQAQTQAEAAASATAKQEQTVTALSSDVSDLKQNSTNTALTLQETQKTISGLESPLAIHVKGITITPGGFLAAETVWRQRALAADINTPFNSTPFSGSSQSKLSEFFGSGRQSRISMLAEGKLKSATLRGYVEADFLSAGVTSNNNESNSYTLRQRQAWGQAALSDGWTFTGGQMWSLVTETKVGEDNRSEALPMTIDPNYTVGFSWARQYGFRVTKKLSDKLWVGGSVEDSQITLGGHGASNNFLLGQQGSGGGLYNGTTNYSYNASTDFIGKIVFEPGFGHYEVFGVISDFRDRIYPGATLAKPSVSGAFNNSAVGGGAGANARWTFAKKYDVGIHFLGGSGTGRYGTSQLADVVASPGGLLTPVTNYQALGTLEYHGKKLDVYLNYGAEYEDRTLFANSPKVGYGSTAFNNSGCDSEVVPASTTISVATPPETAGGATGTGTVPNPGSLGTPLTGGYNPGSLKNCNGDTRVVMEGTIGFWYRFYQGPKGRLQWGPQYSYIDRNIWAGTGGSPNATENMLFTSFRYYLP